MIDAAGSVGRAAGLVDRDLDGARACIGSNIDPIEGLTCLTRAFALGYSIIHSDGSWRRDVLRQGNMIIIRSIVSVWNELHSSPRVACHRGQIW